MLHRIPFPKIGSEQMIVLQKCCNPCGHLQRCQVPDIESSSGKQPKKVPRGSRAAKCR